jgi:hypothetical protein
MKQVKYLSGNERGGLKVFKVNLPVLDGRLDSFFFEGKENWLYEGLLVSSKTKIKEEGL